MLANLILWDGRFPIGKLSIIGGEPGVGKTYLTAFMAAAVSVGTAWPDAPDQLREPADVLLINGEDGLADTLVHRIQAAGGNLKRIRAIPLLDDAEDGRGEWFTLDDVQLLEDELSQLPGCRLVVIDPVSAFVGDRNENRNAEIRGLLGPLSQIAAKYRVAIVLVTHPNKASDMRAIHRMLGSVGWVGAARFVWAVGYDQTDDDVRILVRVKGNLAKDAGALAFKISGDPAQLQWLPGIVNLTADEVLSTRADEEDGKGALPDAVDFLKAELREGPLPSKELFARGRDAGHAERTLRRAKNVLGLKPEKTGMNGGWVWPQVQPDDGQDLTKESNAA